MPKHTYTMDMTIGSCAVCGEKLYFGGEYFGAPSVQAHTKPLNTQFDDLACAGPDPLDPLRINSSRPYFCYDDCSAKAVSGPQNVDYNAKAEEIRRQANDAIDDYNDYIRDGEFSHHYSERVSDLSAQYIRMVGDGVYKSISDANYETFKKDTRHQYMADYFREYYERRLKIRKNEAKERDRQQREQERQAERDRRDQERAEREGEREYREWEREHAKLPPPLVHITHIPMQDRFEHLLINGRTGSGKTSAITHFFLEHVKTQANPPAIIVIDPKGKLVDRLMQLEEFRPEGYLGGRLVILDPSDKPPLNLFELSGNHAFRLLAYIFSTAKFPMTGKQSAGFNFLCALVQRIPNANLQTMLDIIRAKDLSAYQQYINQLSKFAQDFFAEEFFDEFKDTKEQIKSRIYTAFSDSALLDMFNAKTSCIDWEQVIAYRNIVLVNTGLNEIGLEACEAFGRYVVAAVVNAALKREGATPVHLYIDEAQLVLDEHHTDFMLSLVREYKLAITISCPHIHGPQFTPALRNALTVNTGIKLTGQSKEDGFVYFDYASDDKTGYFAVDVKQWERADKMNATDMKRVIDNNRIAIHASENYGEWPDDFPGRDDAGDDGGEREPTKDGWS